MIGRKEREIFATALDWHVEEEQKILEEYRALAAQLKTSPVSLLTDLILTDEDQHHLLLRNMAKKLKEPFNEKPVNEIEDVNLDELLQHTRRLREREKETVESCLRLKSQIATEEPELFDAILDALIFDSEKHQRLLLAVEKMLEV